MSQKPLNQIDLLDRKGYFSYPAKRYFKNREFENMDGKRCIDFCSTSYLHFDFEEELIEAGNDYVREWGLTTQWSRLEADAQIHPQLEKKIAGFIGADRCFLGHTITSTNYSHIYGIVKKGMIFSDHIVHTVVWEGMRLARDHGAQITRFRHQDMDHLEEMLKKYEHINPKLICVDGIYSVSTELAPLCRMNELANRYNAWIYVDDAHGFGIAGKNPTEENPYGTGGSGLVNYFGASFDRTFYVANFNKAFSCNGAFTTVPKAFTDNLNAFSIQHIFSAPVSPFIIGAVSKALDLNERIGEHRRARIRGLVQRLCTGLDSLNYRYTNHIQHPVVFIEAGAFDQLLKLGDQLFEAGILVGFRASPLVDPEHTGIRVAITAGNSEKHIDALLNLLETTKVRHDLTH